MASAMKDISRFQGLDGSIHLGEERSVLVQHSDLLPNLLLLQRRPPKMLMLCGGFISKKGSVLQL